MSFARINFYSQCLNQRIEVTVILPEYPLQRVEVSDFKEKYPAEMKFPAVYLLNGFTGDYTDWFTMIPTEAYACETGLACVIPSGLNTWYENVDSNMKMKTFIAEELPAYVEAVFPISPDPRHRYIAGISMGGRGAAMLGLLYPDTYRAVGCLSAPLSLEGLYDSPEDLAGDRLRIVESLTQCGVRGGGEADFYAVAERAAARDCGARSAAMASEKSETASGAMPEMLYIIGESDPLFAYEYEKLQRFVQEKHLPVIIKSEPGKGHEFALWIPASHEVMQWFSGMEGSYEDDDR